MFQNRGGTNAFRQNHRTPRRRTSADTLRVSESVRPGPALLPGPNMKSSPSWIRTNNLPVNSRLLCRLSYRGKCAAFADVQHSTSALQAVRNRVSV